MLLTEGFLGWGGEGLRYGRRDGVLSSRSVCSGLKVWADGWAEGWGVEGVGKRGVWV
jgi:hypothetical protein